MSTSLIRPSPQSVAVNGQAATWDIANATNVTLQVSGTYTGTLTFEATADGQTWFAVALVRLGTSATSTTTTGTGQFALPNSGLVGFRVRATTVITGGANLTLTIGPATAMSPSSGGGGGGGTSSNFGDPFPATGTAAGFIDASGNMAGANLDASGFLKVNVSAGSSGNSAASATGAAVPANADYQGVNVGGTLRGQTGVNPAGSQFAADENLASIAGNPVETLDYNTGAGTDPIPIFGMALPGSAGAVAGGTATNPIAVTGPLTDTQLRASAVPVSVASLPLPSSAATAANQVTGNASLASIDGKIVAVNTGAVVVASSALPTGASTAAKQPALGTAGTASTDVLTVQGIASMTPLLVTPAANSAVNVAQINGVTPLMGNGATGTGSPRVTIASDNTPFPIKIDQTTLGTTNAVTPVPSVLGGWTYSLKNGLSNTNAQVKSGQGTLGGYYIYNPNATVAYVQIFDTATGSITVGTTVPKLSIGIPPTSAANLDSALGIQFGTAICVAATTTATGGSAPSTALDCNFWYK